MEYDSALTLSVAIPTYRRSESVIKTIKQVLSLECRPDQILVLDQTENPTTTTESKFTAMQNAGEITWRRLSAPSIPQAMNIALVESDCDIVLFLDDDIDITSEVVKEHLEGHKKSGATVVVGKVRQPWHENSNKSLGGRDFTFTSDTPGYINCAIACNMSVNRKTAIAVGGFDENFVRVAYRFEDEFVQRVESQGGKIYYYPPARISHIKQSEGGTRAFGHHLTTIKPYHSVGAYYFFLRAPKIKHRMWNVTRRLMTASLTRHHLKKPWWIPITFVGELSGMVWAIRLYAKGPRHINK